MPVISTNLRNTRESARLLRTEVANGVTQTNVQKALEQIANSPTSVSDPTDISAANSPYVPLATDSLIYVDTSAGPVTINLRPATERNGIPLSIKDSSGNASTNNVTINRNGAETIETLTAYILATDYGGVTLNPVVGTGYLVAP